jgi:hypothetical protein
MTRLPTTLFALLALLLAPASGCTEDNSLSGSLGDFYRLEFDVVRARLYSSELSIEYVSRGTGAVPVRVTLRTDEQEPRAGETYDLGEHGDVTGRLPDGMEMLPVVDGELTLDEFGPELDDRVRGSFEAKLRAERDTLSLTGTFDTELEPVPDPGPRHP